MLLTFPALAPGSLRWRRTFPGAAEQVAAVRRFVAMLLHDCGTLDDVVLAADELVVNALRHTKSGQPGGSVTVEIGRDPGTVAIAVTDQGGPTEPVVVCAMDVAESGRGLRTVSVLAGHWGWFGNGEGRTVTAVFDTAASAGQDGA